MFYRLVRTIVSVALGLFYRIEVIRRVDDFTGPVMFVGNHPNSLIDPAMVFVITDRQVTFLAREPLFRVPVLGWILRGVDALPVYRKQDHPGLMEKNEGTLDAAANALRTQRAITIFPEGKSHSEPQLSDIKTGCARIALKVAKGGQAMRVIPIGLTYARKHQFRSRVHVEVGEPILVEAVTAPLEGEAEQQWVRSLTNRVGDAMRAVTLNLETWEDLDLIQTADRLFALRNGFREKDPERLRLFAKGASMLRSFDPERFDDLKEDVLAYRSRLDVVRAEPGDALQFEGSMVSRFVARNLTALLFGFPLFLLGLALFFLPFMFLRALALAVPVSRDRVATLKFISAVLMVPLWWTLLTVAGWYFADVPGLVVALVGALPLALFTRYFLERRRAALSDVQAFFKLGSRAKLRTHLLAEGERLQDEIQRTVDELLPKLNVS